MQGKALFIVAATLMIDGSVACSSGHRPATFRNGTLPPGTGQLIVEGKDAPAARAVHCAREQYLTTIKTGDDASGATVMISNAEKLTVEFVRVRNVNSFSGNYNRGLEGDATVALTGTTYEITGSALGYSTKSPEATSESFTIRVSC